MSMSKLKTLLTLFVLLFSSSVFGKATDFDIFHFLKEGYKIISVAEFNKGVLYSLQYKDKHLVNCIYYVTGEKAQCYIVEK